MTTLKIIRPEDAIENYRLAQIQAVTERIARREKKLKSMRVLFEDMRRDINNEDWELTLDIHSLRQLMDGKVKFDIVPLEEAIDE